MTQETLQRPHAPTLSDALRRLQQNEQVNPVAQHSAALPLGARVRLASGIYGVVSEWRALDGGKWRISYFVRHSWAVRHVWLDRGQFEVVAR